MDSTEMKKLVGEKASETGCCFDCAGISCDKSCIQALAELECRLSCGTEGRNDPNGLCDNDCCGPTSGDNRPTETSSCPGECCAPADDQASKTDYICQETAGNDLERAQICCSSSKSDTIGTCCTPAKTNDAGESSAGRGCAASGAFSSCQDTKASCCDPSVQARGGKRIVKCADFNEKEVNPNDHCSLESGARSTTNVACDTHLQRAFDEFAAYVENGLCICRSVLERYGGETCCTMRRSTLDSADNGIHASAATSGLEPVKGKCKYRKQAIGSVNPTITNAKQWRAEKSAMSEVQETCPLDNAVMTSGHEPSPHQPAVSTTGNDIENLAARQFVLLSVSGMTCTGCSRKVESVLRQTEGVSDCRVTFVSGRVEFDLDVQLTTKELVIRKLEKETGFKCTSIDSNLQTLDLLLDSDAAEHFQRNVPWGVESMGQTSKGTYRFSYDPSIVGARLLLASIPTARLAPPALDATLVDGKKRLELMTWATTLAAVLTIPILALNWSDNPVSHTTRNMVSLILATPVQAIAIPEFYKPAIVSLFYSHVIEIDMLVVISISAAYGYSVVAAGLHFAGHELEVEAFFETSTLLITLVLFGRVMSSLARMRAVGAVSVRSLQVEKALLVVDCDRLTETETGVEEIDARTLQIGDLFLVKPHCRVVTDGVVVNGDSSVDESMVTGESTPVAKATGDMVVAGTINGPSSLVVRLTRLPGKNSITDIASLVEGALAAKPRVQDLADRVASWFVPVVVGIGLVVFVIWLVVALRVRGEAAGGAVGTAITYAIAVLAVSCPCAIGLAVPLVLVIAGGVGARSGIIIKSADVVERACQVTDAIFDKTGTLTTGELEVQEMRMLEDSTISPIELICLARSLTQNNEHPVSKAVHASIREKTSMGSEIKDIKSIPGSGIRGTFRNLDVQAGNPFWLGSEEHPIIATLLAQGLTIFCVAVDSKVEAVWALKSTVRPEAYSVIRSLHKRNITCHIVSGDSSRAVQGIAAEVQIPSTYTASRQSPADKQRYIQQLQVSSQCQSSKTVLFIGDGTNDAIAVAQADIGVQVSGSHIHTSDVTRATADVVLLGGLEGVPALLDLSGRAMRRIKFNFVWSAVYNLLAILLAAGAFVKVRIPPAYAGLGEIVSIAPVVVAAVTLARKKGAASC